MKSLCEFYTGNHFRNDTRLSVWDVGIFLIGRVWTMAGQSRMRACILIGTLSSNQKIVSPFPILKKKCSVEFQILKGKQSNIKVGTFRAMFRVTFVMITTMILQTRMLTANSRIGDFQLKISLASLKAVIGTCPCANSLDDLEQFTVSFSSRQKFTFLFFEEAVRIWSFCEFSGSFWIAVMVYWKYFIIKFLFQEANFSSHQ